MSRAKGTQNLGFNFEPRVGSPFDARTQVASYSDLTSPATWCDDVSKEGEHYLYEGIVVYVKSDKKLYKLIGDVITNPISYKITSNWEEVGKALDVITTTIGTDITSNKNKIPTVGVISNLIDNRISNYDNLVQYNNNKINNSLYKTNIKFSKDIGLVISTGIGYEKYGYPIFEEFDTDTIKTFNNLDFVEYVKTLIGSEAYNEVMQTSNVSAYNIINASNDIINQNITDKTILQDIILGTEIDKIRKVTTTMDTKFYSNYGYDTMTDKAAKHIKELFTNLTIEQIKTSTCIERIFKYDAGDYYNTIDMMILQDLNSNNTIKVKCSKEKKGIIIQ